MSSAPSVRVLTVDVDGQPLHVEVSGSGHPLLLCNGIGHPTPTWEPFLAALDSTGPRTLVRFDAPGVGRSPVSRHPLTMASLARIVLRMMEELGFESFDVLGVSLGGAIAQEVARQGTDRVTNLVLVSTLPGIGSMMPSLPVLLEMMSPLRHRSATHLQAVSPWLYGGRTRFDRTTALKLAALKEGAGKPSYRGYLAQVALWWGWSSLPWLWTLPMPVLVLTGDDDPIVPAWNSYLMKAFCPKAELHVIGGGGHLLLWDDAQRSARTVSSFLG